MITNRVTIRQCLPPDGSSAYQIALERFNIIWDLGIQQGYATNARLIRIRYTNGSNVSECYIWVASEDTTNDLVKVWFEILFGAGVHELDMHTPIFTFPG